MEMDLAGRLAHERRTRLATERLLNQTKTELGEANRRLALHARDLTMEIRSNRAEAARVRSEARHLKYEVSHAQLNLERAESAMMIAERRLWGSLETIRDGFAVFGPDNTLIAANRSYLALFDGLEEAKPGVHMSLLLELMADEGLVDIGDKTSREWQNWMMARLHTPRIDAAVIRLWNDQFIKLFDRRTRDGDLVTLALNITDQAKREALMQDALDRAEAANRAKSAFLANMSHEIRTPMNGVIAMAELLSETELSEEQVSYLETIKSSGEALLVIINDVLDYSKIEADKVEFKRAPFDLERCIHDVVTLLQPGAQDKGLELVIDFDFALPRMLEGDAGRVRQVLTNLLGNAIKFTEQGHVVVRVAGADSETEGVCSLEFAVEDTGIGIPEEKRESIFSEFQQVENDRDRTHDGTGLGLAITQRLINAMGGELWVESTLGEGSCFGFSIGLPVVEPMTPESLRAPESLERAIVLGDQHVAQMALMKQLGALGLKTVTVSDLDALGTLSAGPTDLIVLDGEAPDSISKAIELGGFGGFLVLGNGVTLPDEMGEKPVLSLKQPILRRALLSELQRLEDSPEESQTSLVEEAVVVEPAPIEPPKPSAPLSDERRKMRVLAAEDNKTNRFVFEKMLKDLDIDLVFAENGLEAVESFEAQRPDIIFTDISMPKMDGKEATRRIRAMEDAQGLERCPIIAITAHAMEGDAEEILAAGVDHYLTKPLKKQQLFDKIVEAQPLDAAPALPLPADGLVAPDATQEAS